MFIFREYHQQIDGFICSRTRKAFVTAWVLLAVALVLLGAVFCWMGAPILSGWPQDTPAFLDGAWRILNGQTPHKDFYWYIGDLPFYVACLGMKLGRPGVSSLTYGNVFVMVAVGLAAMAILRRRTSAFYACAFSLFTALLAVAPRSLGDPYDFVSYAMVYNRYGEAFLALLGLILFLPPEPALKRSWADWVEAGFAGFCLPLLFFCKVTYFAVGAGFFALACLRGRFPLRQALLGLLSAAAFLTLTLLLTRIPFFAMWHDYRIVMAAQSLEARLISLAVLTRKNSLFLLFLLLLAWEISRTQKEDRAVWRHFFLVVVIFGCELCLVASNAQKSELPLLALAALYGAETIRRQTLQIAEESMFLALRNAFGALLLLVFLLPTLAADLATIRHSAYGIWRGHYVVPATLQSTRLNDFRLTSQGTRYVEMRDFKETVDEGMQLLRRHDGPNMRLAVFLFSNPYHLALGAPPAEGGVVCWSWVGISQRSHPPLQRLVGNATLILAGGGADLEDGYGAFCKPPYGAEWDALHLEVVERTKHFTLFKVPGAKGTL